MARERSRVKKRRRGCLGGCLVRILLLLGVAALLFVAACGMGIIKNDPQTGAPYVTFEDFSLGNLDLSALNPGALSLPDVQLPQLDLPAWPYAVEREGLTVKTLRAGDGEAVLVCSDGYTMLLGAGEGGGLMLCGQLLLCGVADLQAAAALQSSDAQIGGMSRVISLLKPEYLLYTDTQVKSGAYHDMHTAAQARGVECIAAQQGLSFMLGRAQVSVIGPAGRHHTDERDDGLSVRIDYGQTSVLVLGGVTANGEREMIASRMPMAADVLIAASGGSDAATCAELVEAVSPQIALLTGSQPANSVRVRLQKAGCAVYAAEDHGVMTVFSDGQNVTVRP